MRLNQSSPLSLHQSKWMCEKDAIVLRGVKGPFVIVWGFFLFFCFVPNSFALGLVMMGFPFLSNQEGQSLREGLWPSFWGKEDHLIKAVTICFSIHYSDRCRNIQKNTKPVNQNRYFEMSAVPFLTLRTCKCRSVVSCDPQTSKWNRG